MDDGKNIAARIGGIMKAQKKKGLVWQFLDGKYDSIIVLDRKKA